MTTETSCARLRESEKAPPKVMWQKNGSKLILGDCRDVLQTLERVGHVITDPPFDQATSEGARRIGEISKGETNSDARFIDFDGLANLEWLPHALRLASRWTIAFCALEQIGAYKLEAGAQWVRSGIWTKPNSAPQFTGDRPAQGCEGVAIIHAAGKKRWNGGGARAVWTHNTEKAARSIGHPTPKPVPLMLELVELFTDECETVLDPFAGSGTTGVACLRLGRRFIGIEREEKYAAIAVERLEAESHGLSIRAARAGQLPMFGGGQ